MSMATQNLHVPDLRKYEVIKTLVYCASIVTWNVANTALQGIATYVTTTMNGKKCNLVSNYAIKGLLQALLITTCDVF